MEDPRSYDFYVSWNKAEFSEETEVGARNRGICRERCPQKGVGRGILQRERAFREVRLLLEVVRTCPLRYTGGMSQTEECLSFCSLLIALWLPHDGPACVWSVENRDQKVLEEEGPVTVSLLG